MDVSDCGGDYAGSLLDLPRSSLVAIDAGTLMIVSKSDNRQTANLCLIAKRMRLEPYRDSAVLMQLVVSVC